MCKCKSIPTTTIIRPFVQSIGFRALSHECEDESDQVDSIEGEEVSVDGRFRPPLGASNAHRIARSRERVSEVKLVLVHRNFLST